LQRDDHLKNLLRELGHAIHDTVSEFRPHYGSDCRRACTWLRHRTEAGRQDWAGQAPRRDGDHAAPALPPVAAHPGRRVGHKECVRSLTGQNNTGESKPAIEAAEPPRRLVGLSHNPEEFLQRDWLWRNSPASYALTGMLTALESLNVNRVLAERIELSFFCFWPAPLGWSLSEGRREWVDKSQYTPLMTTESRTTFNSCFLTS